MERIRDFDETLNLLKRWLKLKNKFDMHDEVCVCRGAVSAETLTLLSRADAQQTWDVFCAILCRVACVLTFLVCLDVAE